jgi:hypothetical protein
MTLSYQAQEFWLISTAWIINYTCLGQFWLLSIALVMAIINHTGLAELWNYQLHGSWTILAIANRTGSGAAPGNYGYYQPHRSWAIVAIFNHTNLVEFWLFSITRMLWNCGYYQQNGICGIGCYQPS